MPAVPSLPADPHVGVPVSDVQAHPLRRWVVHHHDGLTSYVGAGPHWVSVTDARRGPVVTYQGRLMQRAEQARLYAHSRPDLVEQLCEAIALAWPDVTPAPELWS